MARVRILPRTIDIFSLILSLKQRPVYSHEKNQKMKSSRHKSTNPDLQHHGARRVLSLFIFYLHDHEADMRLA